MKSSRDPKVHQACERQFVEHVERLLQDDRLRLETTRGRPPITLLTRRVNKSNRGADLKRLMSELGKPDRELQQNMPMGQIVEIDLVQKKWWVLSSVVGKLKVV